MTPSPIRNLFAREVSRRIEEVIKVDQDDEAILEEELAEYVVTDSIRGHFREVLDLYAETPRKPHEGVGIWVSGFFGSGKSSFAKYLGLALANRTIGGQGAAEILGSRAADTRTQVLLRSIVETIPTEAVIFDVSTERGIRTGNQSLTEILYRLLLKSLGYASDLDLSALEIALEEDGRLSAFEEKYHEVFQGKDWTRERGKPALAMQHASRVMHELEPKTYPTADSWRESAARRSDITPGDLARRALELMNRRRPGKALLFVVDEVGQFVARDVQKMLALQSVVEQLGKTARGKIWLVVTSQERLGELVGGLDDKRIELNRLLDRFKTKVHLEPCDISEVTARRVLRKTAEAEALLAELFRTHRGRLTDTTRLAADIRLPELTTESFADLYPLLPYQIDLIIEVVSGLRTQGGLVQHVGGANRTIIKLAQQLLIHPEIGLQSQPVGTLARLDLVYDLVCGNISTEVRGKIADIARKVEHPLAPAVAKSICLLQYVRSVHRTAENIAASLHPSITADSRLGEVKAALTALEKAHMVRLGEDGYRIPSPAEDDWERQRASLSPRPGDVHRLQAEIVSSLWQPIPSHSLFDVKLFKAGLFLGGHLLVDADVPFQLMLADAGREYEAHVEEARRRSQSERDSVFWVAAVDETIRRETDELFRSKEILTRRERGVQTKDEGALVAEEKIRQRRHQDELRRLLRESFLAGSIFFQGNDRSPDPEIQDVVRAASRVLAQALPSVFERFGEAAARVGPKDLEALLTSDNLRGLPAVFTNLDLVRDQGGKPVFRTESGPLAEVLARIENRVSYGETASGKFLTDEFSKRPFGWDFEVMQLLVVSLLRAGKIAARSQNKDIESALSVEARNTLPKNNLFRSATFHPRMSQTSMKDWADAAEAFRATFGKEMPEIASAGIVAASLRSEIEDRESGVEEAHAVLRERALPGCDILRAALDQMRAIRAGKDDAAITGFNGCHKELREAIRRSAELVQALPGPRLLDLDRARRVLSSQWPFLRDEPDLGEAVRQDVERLGDILGRETFYREMPALDECARRIEAEFDRRRQEASAARSSAYTKAIESLRATPGWQNLGAPERDRVARDLVPRTRPASDAENIPLLRADVLACPEHLNRAREEMLRLIDGNRIVKVPAASYFAGGIDTVEQLDQALDGLRAECLELLGTGKKILVQ